MKKIIPFVLAAALLFTACGSTVQQTTESTQSTEEASVLPDAGLTETETGNTAGNGGADTDSAVLDKAKAYIGKDLSELTAEFGDPESEEYASSCLGPGEDGMLTFAEFVVYTYREDGQETVTDVDVD